MLGKIFSYQLLTGVILSTLYIINFRRVINIYRERSWGFLLRWGHSNIASLFFLFVFIHLFRGIFYSSNKKSLVWRSGWIIMLILIGIAFLGYVLPIGQISLWGATVITGLIRVVSSRLVVWVWGDYAVSSPTITLFFTFHFLLPIVLAILILVHIVLLHFPRSSTITSRRRSFHPLFVKKDRINLVVIFLFTLLFLILPFILGDPLNFEERNTFSSPIHILPEWYFLWAYAILRGIPNKRGGVLALLIGLFFLWAHLGKRWRILTSSFIILSLRNLSWLGGLPVEEPFVRSTQRIRTLFFLARVFIRG